MAHPAQAPVSFTFTTPSGLTSTISASPPSAYGGGRILFTVASTVSFIWPLVS
jgi:hypothetical protein